MQRQSFISYKTRKNCKDFQKKSFFLIFFEKIACISAKVSIFATAKQKCWGIGVWCNGNTTDSGPVIPGSNPGIPTESLYRGSFFYQIETAKKERSDPLLFFIITVLAGF